MCHFDNIVKQPFRIRQSSDGFEVHVESILTIVLHDESGLNNDFDPVIHGIPLALYGLTDDFLSHNLAAKVDITLVEASK